METIFLIKELREKGVAVKLVEDQLEVSLLKENVEDEVVEIVRNNKEQIINYLQSISINKFKEIPKAKESNSYPASNAQFRIWFESQSTSASIAYHIPFEVKLVGDYDKNVLEEAIRYAINRHEILRTVFRLNSEKELQQHILSAKELNFNLDYKDFTEVENSLHKVNEYIKEDLNISFDLENGPLLRAALLKYENNSYYFYCNLHHIICDAWSIPILKSEILTVYTALKANKLPELPELRIQYKDFTLWSLENLEGESFLKQKAYWLDKLSTETPVLELPIKSNRPPVKTYHGQTLKTYFNKNISSAVNAYQKSKEGSLYMVMLSTLHVMLAKYTGNNDSIIGSPFAAREHMDLNNQIGFYTNTLAIRNRVEKSDSFDTFFAGVKQSILEAHNNQQFPFEELVKELKLKKDPSRNPLFDVMLVVLPKDGAKNEEQFDSEESLETITVEKSTTSKFDLLIYIEETENELLSLKVEYNTDLFEEKFIRQFIGHYKKIVELLLTKPQESISGFNYLEGHIGIQNLDLDINKYKKDTVIAFLEKQVIATPDAIALHYEDVKISYLQLNNYSNQIAKMLRDEYNVLPNTNIGVLLDRSQYNVIAMLGVIKSGACYVPIDSKYQESQREYIIADAEITNILTTSNIKYSGRTEHINLISLDEFQYSDELVENPVIVNELDDSSFIIYTSGSTGNPKGVIQTHRMLSNLIQWNIYDSGISSGLRHLQYTSFSFDVSLQDVWFVLSSGGVLYVTPESMKLDFSALSTYIIENKIEVLCFPFSAMTSFFDHTDTEFFKKNQLKDIISSGEQLIISGALERFLLEFPHVKLHNHYGPSETHVVTSFTISANTSDIIHYMPIGKPLANTTLYILDSNLQPVPNKVIGEIYIGGENVAKGYVKLPELTQTRFISNPLDRDQKLYKTGDLAYMDYSGNIIYLGRNDTQVKIRGFRIEPEEIEIQIQMFSNSIEHTVVEAKKINGENALVVYYVSDNELDKKEVVRFLNSRLPDYMVPNFYVKLDNIPLTPNGKVNRKALPDVTPENSISREYVAPTNETEAKLAAIWQELLGIEKVGIEDNFFELGGHSLYIVRMIYKINEIFEIKINMKDVFTLQSIRELAKAIDDEILFKGGVNVSITEETTTNQNSEVWEI
ncbi:amino acid adenylation domain-containing protein [Flavobacterium sp. 90]|uniref:non-ribosomal peptide synthetase n=1 Tax=unclassified Flavobacterium TaxID=196869 RepID=UPI000EB381DB|nr:MULTISPECIES: non-ribosomal peptide synthetase [unclassified Flavobacterium]RKR12097.1 amino acid adenylation domain-containing protein [Flavobacterium sp. 81]TCK55869.1 amino acid adenylation domain-containing protein [Flavobacterium sp. 90]